MITIHLKIYKKVVYNEEMKRRSVYNDQLAREGEAVP